MSTFALSSLCNHCHKYFEIKEGKAYKKPSLGGYPFPLSSIDLEQVAQELQEESILKESVAQFPSASLKEDSESLASIQKGKDKQGKDKQGEDQKGEQSLPFPSKEEFEKVPLHTRSLYPPESKIKIQKEVSPTLSEDEEQAQSAQQTQVEKQQAPEELRKDHIQVTCFECQNVHQVHKRSSSSLCPKCGFYISLKSYAIKGKWAQQIKTRGNVRIYKKGIVHNISIQAHHLIVEGIFTGGASCTGDLIIRNNAKIMGPVECQRLIIENKAQVNFADQVYASSVELDGRIMGDITCTGSLQFKKRAKLKGNIHVRAFAMEEGASHQGQITMISDGEAVSNILQSIRRSFREEEG